jgi:hypothetical protein
MASEHHSAFDGALAVPDVICMSLYAPLDLVLLDAAAEHHGTCIW